MKVINIQDRKEISNQDIEKAKKKIRNLKLIQLGLYIIGIIVVILLGVFSNHGSSEPLICDLTKDLESVKGASIGNETYYVKKSAFEENELVRDLKNILDDGDIVKYKDNLYVYYKSSGVFKKAKVKKIILETK
jgi:hypothetical protein